MTHSANLPRLLEAFFVDRLMRQRQASPHTIASYRDTFRLLLAFAEHHLGKAPSSLSMADVDASFVSAFLDSLEKERGNSARSRNVRLAAIRSFHKYVGLEEPCHAELIQRVLAMPSKRWHRKPVEFLTRPEIEALLAAPDRSLRRGRRDHTLLLIAAQTGLRVSELIGLRSEDCILDGGAYVRCQGKGRKERCTPLRREAAGAIRAWLRERKGHPGDPLFPNRQGGPLSRDAVEHLLAKHLGRAAERCASLKRKRVSPHVLRHSVAMDLLHHGVDRSVIALWLGHESSETTEIYLHADMALKERALEKTAPFKGGLSRYQPNDKLLTFLNSL